MCDRVAVKCCCDVAKTVFNDCLCSFQYFSGLFFKDLFQVAAFPHIYFEIIFFLLPAFKRVLLIPAQLLQQAKESKILVDWNTKSSSDDFIGCFVSAPKRVKSLFAHKHRGVRRSEVHRVV